MNNRTLKVTMAFFMAAACAAIFFRDTAVGENIMKVPFRLDRNRIIIPTSISGSRPLDLILDTGMTFDGVYMFHKDLGEEMDMSQAIEVRVPGAGSGEASTAQMIENGRITFGEVTVDSQRVIISESPHTQNFQTDGVIGWNLFGRYAVQIDYNLEEITLHDTSGVSADSTWLELPITLKSGIPFLECKIEVVEGEVVPVSLYIDLASGDALELLVKNGQKYTMPDGLESSYLGTGLSGDIHGSYGRSRHLWIGNYLLTDITTAFAPAEVRSKQEGADGILGNDCIRRFNVIFDYAHGMLYLRPSKYFEMPFERPQG